MALMAIDPDPDWKAMKKAGKQLFRSLGELRDIQIMVEWIDRLHPAQASVGAADSARAIGGKVCGTQQNELALPNSR